MNHETPRRSVAVTVVLLVAAAVLWSAVLALLVFIVPHYERVFRDENRHLPAPTQWTIAAGRWAANYWYIVPLFGLLALPVVVLLSWLLRHRAAGPLPGWIWFAALLGIPVLMQVGIWLSLLLP